VFSSFVEKTPIYPLFHTLQYILVLAIHYVYHQIICPFDFPHHVVDPGQKAPFEITVGTDKVMGGDLSIIDHYAVQVSGQQ
jgi:hypothetical protein